MKKNKRSKTDMDMIAEMLKVSPEALKAFEDAYEPYTMEPDQNNLFGMNAKQAAEKNRTNIPGYCDNETLAGIVDRAVDELIAVEKGDFLLDDHKNNKKPLVSKQEILGLPEGIRPQLTGRFVCKTFTDMNYPIVFDMLLRYKQDPVNNIQAYYMFRRGLDTLDLDPVLYETLGMNRNTMGYWFPAIKEVVEKHGFFKIPETRIIKVPLPILQLTRMEYFSLTPTTLKIVDEFCMKAFDLDIHKTYFIKTGIFSSKYDFRNAKVSGEKEVRELGEYLLYINWQSVQMAQPLSVPCIYGAATTNEWVVREYIEDKENNPCIYKGLPLHTEYRVFVDFDTDEILGISPYWEPKTMKKRFSSGGLTNVHDAHDYVIYKSHENVLMKRYHENKDLIIKHVEEMLKDVKLEGQWSVDIMQNGSDFWLIDMALAETSALKECVPKRKLKKSEENWIPVFEPASGI